MKVSAMVIALLSFCAHPLACDAGMNEGIKLALDVRVHTKSQCSENYATCSDVHSSLSTTGYYDVRVVVYHFNNISAAEYSLEWPSSFYFSGFVNCGDQMIGGTGEPAIDVAQVWKAPLIAAGDSAGVSIGWLKLSSDVPGEIRLIANQATGRKGVVDSLFGYDAVPDTFRAVVGQATGGSSPCP